MENLCKHCANWFRKSSHRGGEPLPTGVCAAIVQHNPQGKWNRVCLEENALITGEDFGCVHYKEKRYAD